MEKDWIGYIPERCEVCSDKLVGTFIDGKTHAGYWAIMCPSCHILSGVGLGTGKGQLYNILGERLKG